MSKEVLRSLPEWFQSRPRWVQFAAARLSSGASLDDELISRLEAAAIAEAEGRDSEPLRMLGAIEFDLSSEVGMLRLVSVSDPRGINALAPRNPLHFGTSNLSIVYGQNGSGKSGYTRLLKHLCGAPRKGDLHPNVFTEASPQRGCTVSFESDGSAESREWEVGSEAISELKGTLIFDANSAEVYVSRECEVTFEPRILSLFTELARACDAVSNRLNSKLQAVPSRLPDLPNRFVSTSSGAWYGRIDSATTFQQVEDNCSLSEADTVALRMLQEASHEQTTMPAPLAKAQLSRLREMRDASHRLRAKLEDSAVDELERLRTEVDASESAATLAASGSSSLAKLPGIGEAAWFALWEAARTYSERFAYPQKSFPNADAAARCVLCHQELDSEAVHRFQSFESFVGGELVHRAEQARTALEASTRALGEIPDDATLRVQLTSAGVHEEGTIESWLALHQALRQRREGALGRVTRPSLPSAADIDGILAADELRLSKAAAPDLPAESPSGDSIPDRLLELEARRWVTDQRAAIEAELGRLERVGILERARQSASTTSLSRKKGELADELVSQAFQERFQQELGKLRGQRIRVKIERTRVERGRALHQMRVEAKSALPPAEVLSEGERRIIALAGFLADAGVTPACTPFIFDDPISSLDQDFEEAVVERLVELSKERQVIVFTHRLSLLTLLQEAAERSSLPFHTVCVRFEPWGAGEPSDVSLDADKPQKALNRLRGERLAKAKKVYLNDGSEAYAPLAKAICSDFRILLERVVEVGLLGGIVQRFRRSVQTKNRMRRLSLIRDEDVKLIDELMTKYSIHEHSQSPELPTQSLPPEEIEKDIAKVVEWYAEFAGRSPEEEVTHSIGRDASMPPPSGEITRVSTRRLGRTALDPDERSPKA